MRRGLCATRTEAQEAIAAGLVTIAGAPALKAATQVAPHEALVLLARPRRFVSRGGGKLDHALDRFGIDVSGQRCLDAGVSTGGFTDCMLQRGAAHVFAVDVGYGQVHERIRTDDRVTVRERTNIRDVTPGDVPSPPPTLVVADLSFIALRTVLPTLVGLAAPGAAIVALVKPQFEARRDQVGKGGVVRDPEVWREVLRAVCDAADDVRWPVRGITASPLPGPAGNVEFLALLRARADGDGAADTDDMIDAAVDEGRAVRAGEASP